MIFRQLFDRESCTYTYLLGDRESGEAVLIDPVVELVDRDLTLIEELGLALSACVDTHVHADHITAAHTLKQRTGCTIVYPGSGSAEGADWYLDHGEVLAVGAIRLEARHTPGHTAGSATYVLQGGGKAFTGDTLLIRGCGRTDFQGGSSADLYRSVHAHIFSLPDDTVLYPGHDYKGRTMTTVAEEKRHNPRLGGGRSLESFSEIMDGLGLAYPKKIDVAVPANLRLGRPVDPWLSLERSQNGAVQAPIDWVQAQLGQVRLVDVRGTDEFMGSLGHIDGSELVPMGTIGLASKDWDRENPVVLVCRSGGRSDRAALALEKAGFSQVASMTGGMMAWNGAGAAAPGSCG